MQYEESVDLDNEETENDGDDESEGKKHKDTEKRACTQLLLSYKQ